MTDDQSKLTDDQPKLTDDQPQLTDDQVQLTDDQVRLTDEENQQLGRRCAHGLGRCPRHACEQYDRRAAWSLILGEH